MSSWQQCLTSLTYHQLFFAELRSQKKSKEAPSASEEADYIEELGESNDEVYVEETSKPKAATTKTKKKTMSDSQNNNKQAKGSTANALSEAAQIAHEYISVADADVDQNRPAAESVYLSGNYMVSRTDEVGNSTDHICYAILVVAHSAEDAKRVEAKAFSNNGTANCNVVRIEKPTYPSWMSGNKLKKVTSCVFGTNASAAKAFRKSIIRGKSEEKVTLVDVHFDSTIHGKVSKLGWIHLKMIKENCPKCFDCGLRELLELPNLAAFQVEEVVFHQTSEKTVEGYDGELSVSE